MKRILYFIFITTLLSFPTQAQNRITALIDVNPGRTVNFESTGGNTERMFYRLMNSSGTIPEEVLDDMFNMGDQIYRWPGGMTANFYHYKGGTAKGYGLSRQEVEFFPHPMSCNLPNDGTDNCMSFDVEAARNYIYSLFDMCDYYMQRTGKKKRVVWLPNLLTFFVHDFDDISKLDGANNMEDIARMVANGELKQGFLDRLKDNLDVYQMIKNHPSIELVGIEYGNELYFHQRVAVLSYNQVNAMPRWLYEASKDRLYRDMAPGMGRQRSIISFYNRVLKPQENGLKTAFPVCIIPHTGNPPPFNQLYNQLTKDSMLSHVDDLIHHFYFRIDGPKIDPTEMYTKPAEMEEIMNLTDQFIHDRLPKVDAEYDKYFNMKRDGRKLWVTEYNMKNGIFEGHLVLWMNTFYHSYFLFESFLSFIDNFHDDDLVKYAFKHLYVGRYNDFNYAGYSVDVEPDGSYRKIKRATYSTFEILGSLSGRKLKKIPFEISNSLGLERKGIHFYAYYQEPDINDPADEGKVFILFSNKSGTSATLDLTNDLLFKGPLAPKDEITVGPAFAYYSTAPHLYTSNGKTYLNNSAPEVEEIQVIKKNDIEMSDVFEIPGISQGYIAIPFRNANVETSINRPKTLPLSIRPNPTNSIVEIALPTGFTADRAVLNIADMAGRMHTANFVQGVDAFIRADISSLPAGMYQVTLQQDGKLSSGQLVKQ